jgi:hypothetical protein
MKHSDVQRTIENLENALRVHPDKGYEIGTIEEAQKFAEKRGLVLEKNLESSETGPENKKLEKRV